MNYSGKVVLITGGGSGMGQLAARNCAAAGAKLGYSMRRWFPGLVWKNSHKIEGG